jgi:hypothetical protein
MLATINEDSTADRMQAIEGTCRQMIHLAGKGEWQQVSNLEQKRSAQLSNYLSAPASRDAVLVMQKMINRLIELNDELVATAIDARQDLAAQLGKLGRGRKALDSYLSSE